MDTLEDNSITRAPDSASLLGFLSNPLILYQTAPYLPPASLLALGATSKSFHELIHHTQGVFRHLDLTNVKSVKFDIQSIDHGGEVWRNVQLDENVTEDEFATIRDFWNANSDTIQFLFWTLKRCFWKPEKEPYPSRCPDLDS
jgi:hypothetical protein